MLTVKVLSLDPDYSDFILLNISISNYKCSFLLDTQADISLIKRRVLHSFIHLNTDDLVDITGVTDSPITTLGNIDAVIGNEYFHINHVLHVVPNSFHIPSDGILGKDFMKKYKCNIDYESMLLTFYLNEQLITVPILEGPHDNVIVLPARSEIIRKFDLKKKFDTPQIVDSQEIIKGVFIARTIVDSSQPLLKIMNTTNEVKVINNTRLNTESLSDYDVYTLDDAQNTAERKVKLLNIIQNNTPKYAHKIFLPLCEEFADIFALETDKMTTNNFYTQKLRITDNVPTYVKNYRLPHSQKAEIQTQVDTLLANDLIEPSASNYNSPIILVPKPPLNGKKRWRMCLDYRQVNKKLIADKFPLPRIDEILDSLGRAKHFSVIDLFQGFHQIPLDPESRDITSFSTGTGSYRWKVLPFGLNVCPNSFTRMMTIAFSGIPPDQAFLYIDDIIVIGKSEKHHLTNLKSVFEVLRKYKLKIHPHKCKFFKSEVTFLGHLCTSEGIRPDPEKSKSVKLYPIPTDKDGTRRFVAFANYYRRFIENFSLIAKPLNNLSKKKSTFEWTSECQRSFLMLKDRLLNPPILAYPDFDRQFIVTVDASNKGCGAVLSQIFDGQDLPISFASKTWSDADAKKSTPIQECLGIHFALTQFRPYVYGTSFLVRTDHKSLIYLFTHKTLSPKLIRIRLDLEDYNFTIEHIKGTKNVVADALSRISMSDIIDLYGNTASVLAMTRSMTKRIVQNDQQPLNDDDEQIPSRNLTNVEFLNSKMDKDIPRVRSTHTTETNDSNEIVDILHMNIYRHHKKMFTVTVRDVKIHEVNIIERALIKVQEVAIRQKIYEVQWPLDDKLFLFLTHTDFTNVCKRVLTHLRVVLLKRPMIVTDEARKLSLLNEFHSNPMFGGHCGQKKLYANLRSRYFWKNMKKEINDFVKCCPHCKLTKVTPANKEKLLLTSTPIKPFDSLIIDTIGPLPTSRLGNRYAVTIICDLTKYLVIVPIFNKEATTVAKAIFKHFVLLYGLMKNIRTDMGTEYINSVLASLSNLLKFTHDHSTAHRHQTVGTIERSHRTFNEYIRSYISDSLDDWEEYAQYFQFCYNISHHSSYDNKYTPYELVFCKKPILPFEWLNGQIDPLYNIDDFVQEARFRLQVAHKDARQLIDKMKLRNKLLYDKSAKPIEVNVGEKVKLIVKPYNKYDFVYEGPYTIKSISGLNVEIIDDKNKTKTVHKDRIRLYN